MTLPASGSTIALSQVNVELNVSATTNRSLNEATTRALFGVPSGTISLSQGWGKANTFPLTITNNFNNLDSRVYLINSGWNQVSKAIVTINSGVYISSGNTGVYALNISGTFPNGIQLINNGYIVGMGGAGGHGQSANGLEVTNGAGGGPALYVSTPLSMYNYNLIAGGGGGGGGAGRIQVATGEPKNPYTLYPGGGGGGGRSSLAVNSAGGAGGTSGTYGTGGVGLAGGVGTYLAPGAGGEGGWAGARGGNGGEWGSSGATGDSGVAGGAGGTAIYGNNNITWFATGTRLGVIS